MIPKAIKKNHVNAAIEEIRLNGIPDNRHSVKYYLNDEKGNRFPPKYVLSIAHKKLMGSELGSKTFSGGSEANNYLKNLGFVIKIGSSKS